MMRGGKSGALFFSKIHLNSIQQMNECKIILEIPFCSHPTPLQRRQKRKTQYTTIEPVRYFFIKDIRTYAAQNRECYHTLCLKKKTLPEHKVLPYNTSDHSHKQTNLMYIQVPHTCCKHASTTSPTHAAASEHPVLWCVW